MRSRSVESPDPGFFVLLLSLLVSSGRFRRQANCAAGAARGHDRVQVSGNIMMHDA
jgi:hypothetical protein